MLCKRNLLRAAKIAAGVLLAVLLSVIFIYSSKVPRDLAIASVTVDTTQMFLGDNLEGKIRFGVTYYNKKGEVLNGYVSPRDIKLYSTGGVVDGLEVTDTESDSITVYCTVDGIKSNELTVTRVFSSNLPIMVFTPKGNLGENSYATIKVYDNGSYNTLDDECDTYSVKYSKRGKWSTVFPKPQYNIKLVDEKNQEISAALLGMTAGSDFVMNNPYADKSLIRNYLAYNLGEQILEASLESRLCEVWIDRNGNGELVENEYFGVYLICEKITRKNVGVVKNEGYIVARDKVDADDVYFTLPSDIYRKYHGLVYPFAHRVKYPTESKITKSQLKDIQEEITDLHNMITAEPITETAYKDLIDIESYIDALLINEVMKNADGFFFSTYFYKENAESKLKSGPVWDFDLSAGNLNRETGALSKPEGFYMLETEWTVQMLKDPEFKAALRSRYAELREGALSDENIIGIIDGAVELLCEGGAVERNFDRFPELMDGRYKEIIGDFFVETKSYEEEISLMKSFLINRLEWLDREIPNI
ncbi:MAG: CotH kinase family protein [Clostridia bacterium]|nr:CotH kinase family protein [Clostridia bacterium]